jgi:tetratricopeptide (TPR) repeat protein
MMCNVCAQPAANKCGKCKTHYCSRECQVEDWKTHKTRCNKPISPCQLCGLERGPHTTVVLPCGDAFHGECVVKMRETGECSECGDALSDPPAEVYKQAMEKLLDRKQTFGDDILALLKEAAAQDHPLSQLRASDMLAEENKMGECEYWLRKAVQHPCIVGVNAKLKLGILLLKRDLDESERLFYEGRIFFDRLGEQKHPAISSIHAQLCFYTAEVAVAKNLPENASFYYEKAVSLHSKASYLEVYAAHLLKMGKYAAAEPVLRKCVKKSPNANVLAMMGECQKGQGVSPDAWFKRALKMDPLHPKATLFFKL